MLALPDDDGGECIAGIIGYGEDALTLWALKNRLEKILRKLDDDSKRSDCTVFYRPSFGRGGINTANFGEFDAIISTRTCVYLTESKWEGSVRSSARIRLSAAQLNRHAIFKEYFDKWDRSSGIPSLTASASGFLTSVSEKRVVSEKNELAKHLEFVLSRTAESSDGGARKDLRNVLLILHRQEEEPCLQLEPESFGTVVPVKCPPSIDAMGNSWFFKMDRKSVR
jgi:hypothetical protein